MEETSWNEECEKMLKEGKQKINFTAKYDDKDEKVLLVQIGLNEEDLRYGLNYAVSLKRRKKIPIESILRDIPRIRDAGRQVLRPINVS